MKVLYNFCVPYNCPLFHCHHVLALFFRMPGKKQNYFKCILCSKETKPKERRKLNKALRRFLRRKFLTESTSDDVICNKCRVKYYKVQNENNQNENRPAVGTPVAECSDDDQYRPPTKKACKLSSPPSVALPIPSTSTKRKRRRSDPVLWQNPLYQQKIRKPKDNTHKRHQKLRLHNDCGPT